MEVASKLLSAPIIPSPVNTVQFGTPKQRCYTGCMTRPRAAAWSSLAVLAGAGLIIYLFLLVPPRQDDGELSLLALVAFFAGLLLLVSGASALAALGLHQRWPGLAGVDRRRQPSAQARPEAALRQGFLLACVVATVVALSMMRLLDPAFIVVTMLLAGLVEAYWQRLGS
jgi:hypothetical protein